MARPLDKLDPVAKVSGVVLNGVAYGEEAEKFALTGYNVPGHRPYFIDPEMPHLQYVGVKNGEPREFVSNDTTLSYDQWKYIDKTVGKVSRKRRGAIQDLIDSDQVFDIPGGIGQTLLLTQQGSDPGVAQVSMDAIQRGERDRPVSNTTLLPLPIISADWSFTWREIESAATSGMPLDTWEIEACTERVMEIAEKFVTGTYGTYYYAGGTIYGYTNYPNRLTGALDDPTGGGWTPKKFLQNVIAMRSALYGKNRFGPYKLYVGLAWDDYLDLDFSDVKGDGTLRERVLKIGGGVNAGQPSSNGKIMSIETLDFLPPKAAVLVEMRPRTARLVRAMPLKAIRWETHGGLMVNGKVMTCIVPQFFKDYNNQVGLAHYTY